MADEKLEFDIDPKTAQGMKTFMYSQLFCTPPVPKHSFAGQTVIVTGSNVGLGLEAARQFYQLNCARLILAVRTVSKGNTAKEDIIRSVRQRSDADSIEVWPLDLSSNESTIAFVKRAQEELPRLDVLVENAGINNRTFVVSEGYEQTIQVNVLNTFLVALGLLPKMIETKQKFPESSPHLSVVSSEARRLTKFREVNAANIYEKLNEENTFNGERYGISKLLETLLVREIVARLGAGKSGPPDVVINLVSPGLCRSEIDRNAKQNIITKLLGPVLRAILYRDTDVGARTFVLSSYAGPGSHGEFLSDGKNQVMEQWLSEDLGKRVQDKVFEQTMQVLRARIPGLGESLGL